jgi:hypothetical protein
MRRPSMSNTISETLLHAQGPDNATEYSETPQSYPDSLIAKEDFLSHARYELIQNK